jgi:hypothetical protein
VIKVYAPKHDHSPDDLIRRNAVFAGGGAFEGLPFPSNQILRWSAASLCDRRS